MRQTETEKTCLWVELCFVASEAYKESLLLMFCLEAMHHMPKSQSSNWQQIGELQCLSMCPPAQFQCEVGYVCSEFVVTMFRGTRFDLMCMHERQRKGGSKVLNS